MVVHNEIIDRLRLLLRHIRINHVSRVKLKSTIIEAIKGIKIHRRLSGSIKTCFTKLRNGKFSSRVRRNRLARVQPVNSDDAALLPESFKSANAVGEE